MLEDLLSEVKSGGRKTAHVSPSVPFEKKLRLLIDNPPESSVLMKITPDMAKMLLALNDRNRPLSVPSVKKYKARMKAGWKLTGETIIVSKAGHLLNGQTRLTACIESGFSFPCHVVFGIEDDAFAFIDIGKTRTAADIFSINGVANASAISAACRWVWKYECSGMLEPASWLAPTHDQLFDFYLEHEAIQQSSPIGGLMAKRKIAPPSLMIALHYLCAQKNAAVANEFYQSLATGVGFKSEKQPVAKLRARLIEDGRTGHKLVDVHVAALTVSTWNNVRQNKGAPLLRWRTEQEPDKQFPRIV